MGLTLLTCFVCAIGGVTVRAAAAEEQSATAEADATEYDLRIRIRDFAGSLDTLKGSKLAELEMMVESERKEAAQAARDLRRRSSPATQPSSTPAEQRRRRPPSGMMKKPSVQAASETQLMLRVPTEGKARADVAARVPFTEASTRPDRRGVRVSYGEVGARVEITRLQEPGDQPGAVVLQLKLSAALASPGGGRPRQEAYEKKVLITPGRPVLLPLDDAPVAAGEHGAGRWRAVSLELVEAVPPATPSGQPPAGPTSGDASARLELDCLQITLEGNASNSLDLQELVADAPSVPELMKRLKERGEPLQSCSTELAFDSAKGINITMGQRAPMIQNVHVSGQGVVTPSVTYEEVGTIARIGPLTWEKGDGGELKAAGSLRLENSGVATTSTEVSEGVRLPSFSQWRVDGSYVFRNGVPSYFTFRGPPGPPTPDGSVNFYVARLLITLETDK